MYRDNILQGEQYQITLYKTGMGILQRKSRLSVNVTLWGQILFVYNLKRLGHHNLHMVLVTTPRMITPHIFLALIIVDVCNCTPHLLLRWTRKTVVEPIGRLGKTRSLVQGFLV